VRYVGMPGLGPARGSIGTVAKVATIGGKSIHPDPMKVMTFVDWDETRAEGVYTAHLMSDAEWQKARRAGHETA
jgi:hypothetical protein